MLRLDVRVAGFAMEPCQFLKPVVRVGMIVRSMFIVTIFLLDIRVQSAYAAHYSILKRFVLVENTQSCILPSLYLMLRASCTEGTSLYTFAHRGFSLQYQRKVQIAL